MPRFEIRAALPGDEQGLLAVARHLNSVNLPDDDTSIQELVDQSYRSFSGKIHNPKNRTYVFLMRDLERDTIVGSSQIIAQLGSRSAPYIYFDVLDEEKYSATIDRHFKHTVLRIGYSYNGPTELGGLVMDPSYRKAPEKLGLMISYIRFLFIAGHREWFRDELLAELMPPLEPDGTSHLWEALGRKFTDMSYAEADRLSKKNKEFIKGLFPEGVVYASVLPNDAQAVIGKTGAQTRGVERMLKRVGFRYADRVDPFDGGPHFTAKMDEITLIERSQKLTVVPFPPVNAKQQKALIAVDSKEAPFFRAVAGTAHIVDSGEFCPDTDTATYLGLQPGEMALVLPLD